MMNHGASLKLVIPSLDLEAAYRDCEAEFAAHGETFLGSDANDWSAYVRHCAEEAAGRVAGPGPGRVPQSVFFLVREDDQDNPDPAILGVSKLRHYLNPALEDIGGHIGYSIRPSVRGAGYGTRILALTLPHARTLGLQHVLLTCDTDNIRSARVIQRNGGVLTSEGYSSLRGARISRYWIAL